MKRFVRRQSADDRELKLMARADELKADALRPRTTTVSAAQALGGEALSDVEPVLAAPRPSLDQMWGLE